MHNAYIQHNDYINFINLQISYLHRATKKLINIHF